MTSHYRHRRTSNPATGFSNPLEPGEIAANTANRQLAVGDAAPGAIGSPLMLIAVRFFDARAQYAIGDFVVEAGALYRAKVTISPGAFNAANWEQLSSDTQLRAYVDAQDAAITAAYQAADNALTASVNDKVSKAGDIMTGMLTLPAATPTTNQAVTKKYVDDAITAAGGGGGGATSAANVSNQPAGNIQATNVQAALNELDVEKAALAGAAFVSTPTAPAPPANDNSTKLINSAWYAGQASSTSPQPDGVVSPGTALTFSRSDHIHPTDTSRAPILSPAFGGVPTGPTAPVDTNSNQLATCAFVIAQPVSTIANGIVTFVKLNANIIATAQEFLSAASSKLLTPDRIWQAAAPATLAEVGTTITPDFNAGIDFNCTLGGAGRTLANPTNLKLGQKGVIYLKQPSGGGATITTWGTSYKFPNNGVKPILTATANALDMLTYIVKSANEIECTFIGNMG